MAQQDRSTIKTFFETGDIPTEAQFGDSFDSQVFWVDDVETDLTSNSDDKVPTVKAVVDGIAAIPNELTTDELAAINGANSPDATNVFLTEDDEVYTKDANDNIFYKGVTPTLGTSCSKNIFHKTGGAITLGNAAIGNIFEPTENTTNFVFGANLRNVTIKAGNYPSSPSAGTLNLTAGGYAFLYNKDYPSEIFVGANGAALHSYYDSANDRYVVTNLVTLVSINSGTVTSVNAGTNISVTGTAAAPIINSLSDRYKTTSTTSNTIGNGSRTFTVDANLSYIPLQEVLIVYDPSNHMHGEVTSYNSTTGQLIVDVQHHTGGGTFASWVINLDGTPVDAITGAGTLNRLAYFTAAQVIDDVAAITAARALKSDANGLPIHFDTATEPSLTELSYVKGVTSAIQTQLNAKRKTLQSTGLGTAVTGTTSNTFCKAMLVPANTFVVGDVPMLTTRIIKGTSGLGTITARVYVNTVANISGSPILLATTPAQIASTRSFATMRNISIESATESIVTSATTANSIEEAVTAAAETTMNIDWTIDQYIVVSIQLGSSSDNGNCRYIMIN
jgi:hypothetical protein